MIIDYNLCTFVVFIRKKWVLEQLEIHHTILLSFSVMYITSGSLTTFTIGTFIIVLMIEKAEKCNIGLNEELNRWKFRAKQSVKQ